jgi:hypothetical protein
MKTHTCYDFPLLVLHANDGSCLRYSGGICHPLPTPMPPFANDEEAAAVAAYDDAIANGIRIAAFIKPSGATIYPDKEGQA